MDFGRTVQIFVAGVVTIGLVTALTLPGRKTVELTQAGGKASQGLLATSISGK